MLTQQSNSIYRLFFLVLLATMLSCNSETESTPIAAQPAHTAVPLSSSPEYQLKANYTAFNKSIDVIFMNTHDSISDTQKKNYEGFLKMQDQLQPQIMQQVFEYYKNSYAAYKEGWTMGGNFSKQELEKNLPAPTTPQKLKAFITPSTLFIQDRNSCEEGTFIIEFDCTWDIENGLSVLIKNWKVQEADTAEAAHF